MTIACTGVEPVRTCLGCRVRKGRSALQRLALVASLASLKVVVDRHKKLPGRGAWFCCTECLDKIVKKRLLVRAFKVTTDLDTSELVGNAN